MIWISKGSTWMPTCRPTGNISVECTSHSKPSGGGHFHLIVDALENQVGDNALQRAFLRFYEVDVLRADDHIHRLVGLETAVQTGEFLAVHPHHPVLMHDAVDDVGLADEVGHEGVLRLVVNILRSADLLDLAASMTTTVSDMDRASS